VGRLKKVPNELKILLYLQEQKIMTELPHIPMFWDRAFMGANVSSLSFLYVMLWEREVGREAAWQPRCAGLVTPHCCLTTNLLSPSLSALGSGGKASVRQVERTGTSTSISPSRRETHAPCLQHLSSCWCGSHKR